MQHNLSLCSHFKPVLSYLSTRSASAFQILADMSGMETFFYLTKRKDNRILFLKFAERYNLSLRLSERSETVKYMETKQNKTAQAIRAKQESKPFSGSPCHPREFLTLAPKAPSLWPDFFHFSRLLWPHFPARKLLCSQLDCVRVLTHISPPSTLYTYTPSMVFPPREGHSLGWASPSQAQLKFLSYKTMLNSHPTC